VAGAGVAAGAAASAAACAGGAAGAGAASRAAAVNTSDFVILPAGPLPAIAVRSTPSTAAARAATGETFVPSGGVGVDAAGFDRFLKTLFAQKRKTLQNNLRAGGFASDRVAQAWPASIPAQARAESVALEPLAELYRALGSTPAALAPADSAS